MILPGTGRGTMRGMVEGHRPLALIFRRRKGHRVPLHQLRWSPFPKGEE